MYTFNFQINSSSPTPRLRTTSLNDRIKEDTLVVNNLEYVFSDHVTERVKAAGLSQQPGNNKQVITKLYNICKSSRHETIRRINNI